MRMKQWKWFTEDDVHAATTEQEACDSSSPKCPNCGYEAEYSEGTIFQDYQGNDIRGWWFYCPECSLSTEAVEGFYNS